MTERIVDVLVNSDEPQNLFFLLMLYATMASFF